MLLARHCLLLLLSLFPFLALCFGGEIVPEEALDLASGNTTLNVVELGIKHFPFMLFLLSHQIHILHFLFIKQFLKYKDTCKFLYFGRIFHWTLLGIDWSVCLRCWCLSHQVKFSNLVVSKGILLTKFCFYCFLALPVHSGYCLV